MKAFTALYVQLDQTNSTNEKVRAMADYFATAPGDDAAWAVWFLTGRRLKRLVKRALLKQWVLEESGYPEWVVDECRQNVGDLAETIALLLPEPEVATLEDVSLTDWVEKRLMSLTSQPAEAQGVLLKIWWRELTGDARFVLNKLITGALRVGVSQRLVIRALSQHLDLDTALVAHRLMGDWQPTETFISDLADGDAAIYTVAQPYPFFLASPLKDLPDSLGDAGDWQAEWKWDGIRAQIIRREGQTFIWSRGEDRMDGRFPELEAMAEGLPDGVVLDGEILAAEKGAERFDFSVLQRRIGKRKPGAKLLASAPVTFMVYDLLEHEGADIRAQPLTDRRDRLAALVTDVDDARLLLSRVANAADWAELGERRTESRERGVEGLILKARDSQYGTGRQRGAWWKWKIDPYTIDAVMIYAMPGSGRRSNQFTDYTFAVWDDDQLVPVCKAYSGLTNEEITRVDSWIRKNTIERFGPVRSVTPELVFEIAFEGIQLSKRHKSGVAFRFPRIQRWREDLAIQDAESLAEVKGLINSD